MDALIATKVCTAAGKWTDRHSKDVVSSWFSSKNNRPPAGRVIAAECPCYWTGLCEQLIGTGFPCVDGALRKPWWIQQSGYTSAYWEWFLSTLPSLYQCFRPSPSRTVWIDNFHLNTEILKLEKIQKKKFKKSSKIQKKSPNFGFFLSKFVKNSKKFKKKFKNSKKVKI